MPLKGQPERINANKNPSKGMSEGRRPSHPSGPNGVSVSVTSLPPPPVPTLRKVASNSNLSTATTIVPTTATIPTTTPTPPAQVIQLAREALRQALESESRAVEASAVGSTGVTIDLGRQNIQKLPEEVVDIIKNQVGRLAMSHNLLSSLPARFSECKSLRYLNVRGNQIREFPQQVSQAKFRPIPRLARAVSNDPQLTSRRSMTFMHWKSWTLVATSSVFSRATSPGCRRSRSCRFIRIRFESYQRAWATWAPCKFSSSTKTPSAFLRETPYRFRPEVHQLTSTIATLRSQLTSRRY